MGSGRASDHGAMMEEFNSETDSDYTSYWRDWVSVCVVVFCLCLAMHCVACVICGPGGLLLCFDLENAGLRGPICDLPCVVVLWHYFIS